MKSQTVLPLSFALLLAACASSGGLHTEATPTDADQLLATRSLSAVVLSDAAWPKQDWWHELGDGQLDQLIDAALKDQPSLHIAEARLRQAQALAGAAGAARYPQGGVVIKGTEQRFSENGTAPKTIAGHWNSIDEASFGVSYDLDLWGKNQAAAEAALDRAHATDIDLQAARLSLTTSIVRTYLRLDSAYAERDLAEATLANRGKTLALTQVRVAAELDSKLELTQAEAALPVTRERIAVIGEAIALLANQLAALEGQGPDAGLNIKRPQLATLAPVLLPTALPAELLGRRPDVVAARWRVEAARGEVTVAQAQFYPNVTLNAFVGLQSIGLSDFLSPGSRVLGIGPAFSLPVFDGGRLRSNLDSNQAGYDLAVESYNATLLAALHDIVDQLVSLNWLAKQARQQDQALDLSKQAWTLALARYHSGLASYLQVLSAEGQVLSQQRLQIESKSRQRELQLNLVRALGGGTVPTDMPAITPDASVASEKGVQP